MQDEAWTTDEILAEAQVWVRRLACICFAVMIVAEVITGKVRAGALQTCPILQWNVCFLYVLGE